MTHFAIFFVRFHSSACFIFDTIVNEVMKTLIVVSVFFIGAILAQSPLFTEWEEKVEHPGLTCREACGQNCTYGLDVCSGLTLHVDTNSTRLDAGDPLLYSYCKCRKSAIVREPGSYCYSRGTPCPAGAAFIDGVDNIIPGYQGIILEEFQTTPVITTTPPPV